VDFAGNVRARQTGVARIVASAEMFADTMRMTVLPPAVLAITGRAIAPTSPTISAPDAQLPMLALRLEAQGPEAIDVRALGFDVTGSDRGLHLDVYDDPDGGGELHADARRLGRFAINVLDGARAITVNIDSLRVQAYGVRHVIVTLAVSGAAPNGSRYDVRLAAARIRTVNVLSLAQDRVTASAFASNAGTTVLAADELFALSANPVRASSVIFNFAEVPTTAVVYTASGGRVADLTRRIDGVSFTWDLTNDAGTRVVPGVYLLVMRIRGQLLREKLLVLARDGSAP
jgi:hypothetical protein